MLSKVFINIRPNDMMSFPYLEELIQFLRKNDKTVYLPKYDIFQDTNFKQYITDEKTYLHETDLICVIGGDGTFLRTARMFIKQNKPIFGINKGRLGFLTEFYPKESLKHLKNVFNGNFQIAKRMTLETTQKKNKNNITSYCVNDAVISKGAFSRAIEVEIEIENKLLHTFSGDGLIISTPTGSTAYSLSAGGPIINPNISEVFEVTPVCPHSLSIRPMIISAESELKVRIITKIPNKMLTIDGQDAIEIQDDEELIIKKSPYDINLITHPEKSYYQILREKLGWG